MNRQMAKVQGPFFSQAASGTLVTSKTRRTRTIYPPNTSSPANIKLSAIRRPYGTLAGPIVYLKTTRITENGSITTISVQRGHQPTG
jgi:hypothetical protein